MALFQIEEYYLALEGFPKNKLNKAAEYLNGNGFVGDWSYTSDETLLVENIYCEIEGEGLEEILNNILKSGD